MSQSAIAAALAAHDHEALRAAIYGELSPTIPAVFDPRTWDEREKGELGGNCWPKVTWQEREWYRDGDDNDTDHDGLTTIVTLGGSRYKTNDVRFDPRSVISRSLDTPPEEDGSPSLQYGETWLVPEGASGEWAGHEGERAMWTARGWKFKPPAHGEITLVEDEGEAGQFIHFNVNDEWDDGLPGNVVDASVRPSHLLIRAWSVENKTTVAPPASGPAGEQYIIGPAASGAWAGHDGKIAWRPAVDAAFVITAPFVGERVFDKSLNIPLEWSGTAWVSTSGAYVAVTSSGVIPIPTTAGGAGVGDYVYDPTAAPGTNAGNTTITNVTQHRARRVGAKLEIFVSVTFTNVTIGANYVCAIQRNSELQTLDFVLVRSNDAGRIELSHTFEVTANSVNLDGYRLVTFRIAGVGLPTNPRRYICIIRERA